MRKSFHLTLYLLLLFGFYSCQSIPKGATAVSPFEIEKYMGTWYEIARIDFKFEENLNNTTANYKLQPDGKVKVTNRGYNYVKEEWEEAIGKAKFRGESDVAELKVSFFGPFYAGYNVIGLEGYYEYALVAGKDLDYLWILSRSKSIPEAVKNKFLEKAKSIGYDTSRLIWVEQDKNE
ncbi:lipocalin family protein [Algoriphagus machipongonensis]|uniref:Outer membrane lipoprotein Blc n=1 Tax=Algoriphagus machipongonensis TaxID=388413 RepID=A3HU87_9BACT|nr:lipocalin family protein [Algoriphagus machipongonensis]EAZ81709.1 outer membrane lipoprotein blc [Algoriphagus machipongonensis]